VAAPVLPVTAAPTTATAEASPAVVTAAPSSTPTASAAATPRSTPTATGAVTPTSSPTSTLQAGTFTPQGAQWRRDPAVTTGIYTVTEPRLGSEGGPAAYAVGVWQELLAERGVAVPRTGIYDDATAAAVAMFQRARGLPSTGAVNFVTARALLGTTIRREAQRAGVPVGVLCGHLAAESLLDPRAVGPNGVDLGIAQISVPWNAGLTADQAFDEDYAIGYIADRDAAAFRRYGDWRIAVAAYNSPARASAWKRTGVPDEVARIYADRAFRGCGPLNPTVSVGPERSLWRLAVIHLGDGWRWTEIAALNGIDPRRGVRTGQQVLLPRP
jgi:hypothetical protein